MQYPRSTDDLIKLIARHKLLTGLVLVFGSLIIWSMTSLLPALLLMAFIVGCIFIIYAVYKAVGWNPVSWIGMGLVGIFALLIILATDRFSINFSRVAQVSEATGTPWILVFLVALLAIVYLYITDKS